MVLWVLSPRQPVPTSFTPWLRLGGPLHLSPATDDPPEESDAVLLEGHAAMTSVQQIEIDPNNKYEISGWFKSVGAKPSKVYLGLRPLDENRDNIWPSQCSRMLDSETELVEEYPAGGLVVKVKDASKWVGEGERYVAVDVDTSGEYSDLPNRRLAKIKSIRQTGDHWEIDLAGPVDPNYSSPPYAKGTAVRQHGTQGVHIYCGANGVEVPNEWTYLKGEIRGMATGVVQNSFWPKTKYVSVVAAGNYMEGPEVKVLVGGLRFREK